MAGGSLAGSDASEVDLLRRQLQERDQLLKEKENQLKDRDERLSVLERSSTNSVMSNAQEEGIFGLAKVSERGPI